MSQDSHLQEACELAFQVAREGVSASPPIEVPATMRSFLYTDKLSARALKVAKQSIENDEIFRSRVATAAHEVHVGKAAYLWLKRPNGWADAYHLLLSNQEESSASLLTLGGDMASKLDNATETEYIADAPPKPPKDFGLGESSQESDAKSSDGDIAEGELSGLVGLVDRLAEERGVVSGANGTSNFTSEERVSSSSSEQRLHLEVNRLKNDLEKAQEESKNSKRKHSDALRRQVQLEKQLTEIRENGAETQRQLSDLQASSKEHKDKLERTESLRVEALEGLEEAAQQLEVMTAERNNAREEHAAMMIERDEASEKLLEIDRLAGGVDIGTLQRDNKDLAERALASEGSLSKAQARLGTVEAQLAEEKEISSNLQAEKADVSTRLNESENLLEQNAEKTDTLKLDLDKTINELNNACKQRDELTSQVDELQVSLGEALEDLARVRSESDEERVSFRQMRSERDSLLARMAEIEQTEKSYVEKLKVVSEEKEGLIERQEELVTERGKLKGESAVLQRECDQLTNRLKMLQDKLEPLEAEIFSERRRGEELAANLIEANKERARKESDIKKLQKNQVKSDVKLGGVDEVSKLQEKLAKTENKYKEKTKDLKKELEELKKKLAKVESEPSAVAKKVDTSGSPSLDSLVPTVPPKKAAKVEKTTPLPVVEKKAESAEEDAVESHELEYEELESLEQEEPILNESPAVPQNIEDSFVTTGSSVWDQDWPPREKDFDDDYEEEPLGDVYLADFPAKNNPKNDVDIDEISELLSRTVTDFQAVESDGAEVPPSVFDPATGQWNEEQMTVSDRRQIIIPQDLVSDHNAIVQYVVSAEDVVLLVDGDSVASLGWSKLPVFEQRNSLVSFLADISDRFGGASQVVFDSNHAGQGSLPSSRLIRIRLSDEPVMVIDELLDTFPDQWPIAVVTDNPDLANRSLAKGATIITNEQLLDFINLLATS